MVRGLVVAVAFIVVTFHPFPTGSLQAQPASSPASAAAPAPHKVELLFVQAPALTSTQASAVAKLKELKSLLNQGLITQSQYQADSQKLLNQIVD